jgi:hypothetical protein
MKWFKHNSDAHTNLKTGNVIAEHGAAAYGLWWICVELIASQGEQYCLGADKNWKKGLMRASGMTKEEIDPLLNFFAQERLIDSDALKEAQLYIPNLAEYCDDYSSRSVRTKSESVRTKSQNVPLEEKRREKKYSSEFDQAWIAYPKKVGKSEAFTAFESIKPPVEQVISAIARYKKTSQWQDNDGRYIPHFATFLNQRRFEDEVFDQEVKGPKIAKWEQTANGMKPIYEKSL